VAYSQSDRESVEAAIAALETGQKVIAVTIYRVKALYMVSTFG
jgi:hypothetical protein